MYLEKYMEVKQMFREECHSIKIGNQSVDIIVCFELETGEVSHISEIILRTTIGEIKTNIR